MGKKFDETHQEFTKRVMDPISPSFCAAKWYTAHISLGSGKTKSCHHPPDHRIPVQEVKFDPSALHNTNYKKQQQKVMLTGQRPSECSYCWQIEDMEGNSVSDRTFKTSMFSDEDIAQIPVAMMKGETLPLKRLEISFDRICNFACAYCNPSFSTKWGGDIKKYGKYEGLELPHSYDQDGSWAEPYGVMNTDNPYIEAFWKWWPELSTTLEELRVTGGEPTMSPHFWKLTDFIINEGANPDMVFGVNTNLGMKRDVLEQLITVAGKIPRFKLYTSCESWDIEAEYMRDGLDYGQWLINLSHFLESRNSEMTHIMMCVNALSVFSTGNFFYDMVEYKNHYGKLHPFLSVNLLHYPQFMSPLVLPKWLRNGAAYRIERVYWEMQDNNLLCSTEEESIERLIEFLRHAEPDFDVDKARRDFYFFFKQYDQRRGKSFANTFPATVVEWYEDLGIEYGDLVEDDSGVVPASKEAEGSAEEN